MERSLPDLLQRARSGGELTGIGLMSGTSADGVDACSARISFCEGALQVAEVRGHASEYPAELRRRLLRAISGDSTVPEICLLNAEIGRSFADVAAQCARELKTPPDFVASHGQTIWHHPPGEQAGATLQIGEPAWIAAALGCVIVSDFRQADIAAGGHGAPLAPMLDLLLFRSPHEPRVLLNIGGIANLTFLPAGEAGGLIAFDTGPGNALIDTAAELATGGRLQYDRDGLLAKQGTVDEQLLNELLHMPFFALQPPRSTGRELFTRALVERLVARGLSGAGLVSTLTEFTVRTIGAARRWHPPAAAYLVSGGGAHNTELMARLRRLLHPARVEPVTGEAGVDFKEALAFAVLGYLTLAGRPGALPEATGARASAVLGKISLPPLDKRSWHTTG